MNRICLMGRLCADLELRRTQNGTPVTSFSLAVNRKYDRETADFIDIVAWRQTAEFIAKYFKKGDMAAIEGALQTRTYEDRQGNSRKVVEVIADQVYFCGSKQGDNSTESTAQAPAAQSQNSFSIDVLGDFEEADTSDEDLPF